MEILIEKLEVKKTRLGIKGANCEYTEYRILCSEKKRNPLLQEAIRRNIDTWATKKDNNNALRITKENIDTTLKEELELCILTAYHGNSEKSNREWIEGCITELLEEKKAEEPVPWGTGDPELRERYK